MVNEEEVRGNKKWKRNRFRTAFCMSIVPIRQMWPLLVWSIAPHKSVYKLSSTGGKYRCVKGTHIHKHTHKRTRQNENKPVEPWLKKVEISTHRARPSDMAFYTLLVILCASFYLFIKIVPYHYSRVGHRRSVPGGDSMESKPRPLKSRSRTKRTKRSVPWRWSCSSSRQHITWFTLTSSSSRVFDTAPWTGFSTGRKNQANKTEHNGQRGNTWIRFCVSAKPFLEVRSPPQRWKQCTRMSMKVTLSFSKLYRCICKYLNNLA